MKCVKFNLACLACVNERLIKKGKPKIVMPSFGCGCYTGAIHVTECG